MKKTIVLLLASGFLSGALASTQAGTLAKVDGTDITEEMFEAFSASRTRKPSADLTPEEKAALSEELIKLVAVGAEAKKQKIHTDSTVSAQLRLQELTFLAQKYIERHVNKNPVTSTQLQTLYDKKYSGDSQTEYKARHILVSSPGVASEIISQLGSGSDFVELAAKHSIGPSGKSGGDLGWFTKETMVPEFGNAVANMSSGSHSNEPVQTQFGWHVILKEDERVLPTPDLESVKQELERELQQKSISDLVIGLREKAKVKTFD